MSLTWFYLNQSGPKNGSIWIYLNQSGPKIGLCWFYLNHPQAINGSLRFSGNLQRPLVGPFGSRGTEKG